MTDGVGIVNTLKSIRFEKVEKFLKYLALDSYRPEETIDLAIMITAAKKVALDFLDFVAGQGASVVHYGDLLILSVSRCTRMNE